MKLDQPTEMEEEGNEWIVERVEYLTKQLEEDVLYLLQCTWGRCAHGNALRGKRGNPEDD